MAQLEMKLAFHFPWWRRWPVFALMALSVYSRLLAERILGGGIEVE